MRVTTNSILGQYMSSLNDINARVQRDNIQLSTGKQMVDLSDNPGAVMDIQFYDQNIENSTNYKNTASTAVDELTNTSAMLESVSTSLTSIRQTATDSLLVDNSDKLPTLATNVRLMLQSLIDAANTHHNGGYSFAGTKTSPASLKPTAPETKNLPFELVQEAATASNPSGLRVSFKGNLEKRIVNSGPNSTEQVNVTADEVFGANGIDTFNKVIDVYNKMMYRADGTKRESSSQAYTADEHAAMQVSIKQMADAVDFADRGNGIAATRLNRMQAIHDQMDTDISRMKDLRSSVQDADVGETIMNLNKDQMAMQFAMQAGSKLFGRTLMDFLG